MVVIGCLQPLNSSAEVLINEICFHPGRGMQKLEFVELHNSGKETADLSLWSVTEAVTIRIPDGTILKEGGYLVLAANPVALKETFALDTAVGPWKGKLGNEGEEIVLRNALGEVMDRVEYGAGFPWPVASVGEGASMELIHPGLDNELPGSWRASRSEDNANREPETFVPAGSKWHYWPGKREASKPASAWRKPDFDPAEQDWKQGAAPFGYDDGDDKTVLPDMMNNYTSLFLRRDFVLKNPVPQNILLRLYCDDGAVIWINGIEVARFRVAGEPRLRSTATMNHEAAWEEAVIQNASQILRPGKNVVAVHGVNGTLDSSDFSLDLELKTPPANAIPPRPSPGRENGVFAENAGPQIDKVEHEPQVALSGKPLVVRARVSDPDGVKQVRLGVQMVMPGAYIRRTDPQYETQWQFLPMNDGGRSGDATAGDNVYTATLPANTFKHRDLIRYRITASDTVGNKVRVPYDDDPQPNFACFCYDGIPSWTGTDRPKTVPKKTFTPEMMNAMPAVHVIADPVDVENSQFVYRYNEQFLPGTVVYNGVVYDHIRFRNRGETTTYRTGKNKWRFNFNRTHELRVTPDYKPGVVQKWKRMNLNPGTMPYQNRMRGSAALNERLTFRLYQLADCPAPETMHAQLRVIDDLREQGADQYSGDLWGLYMQFSAVDGKLLDHNDLPDGEIYKIAQSGSYASREPLGPVPEGMSFGELWSRRFSPLDREIWEKAVHLEHYYAYHAVSILTTRWDQKTIHNHYLYRHPKKGWMAVPWDVDHAMQPMAYNGDGFRFQTNLKGCLQYPEYRTAYKNRVREILDIVLDTKNVHSLVGQMSHPLREIDGGNFADLDKRLWNYHPRATGGHRGNYFLPAVSRGREARWGGNQIVRFDGAGIRGRISYFRDFLSRQAVVESPRSGKAFKGWGYNLLVGEARDSGVPTKPVLEKKGALTFESSPFGSGRGVVFAARRWRVAAVDEKGVESVDPVYEAFDAENTVRLVVPDSVLKPGGSYRVRSRVGGRNGKWSHWSDPVTIVAPTPNVALYVENLRISEVMYSPPQARNPKEKTAAFEPSDFEFVELWNCGGRSLDLGPLRFVSGVSFEFGKLEKTVLSANERVLLVRNREAFNVRYPKHSKQVIGEWRRGKLSNRGEKLVLSYGEHTPLISVEYGVEDPWPNAWSGDGHSLELDGKSTEASRAESWRASESVLGSPGK